MMKIGGLQKLTLIDYPGKLACAVFFVGCPFRCPWCHNPELVLPGKDNLKKVEEKDFFAFLKQRKGGLEGVVLSGGEPTLNPELADFCRKIKKMDYDLKLDTNGSNPEMLKELAKNRLLDYVAMDVKAPREKYLKLIGLDEKIRASGHDGQEFWEESILANIQESIDFLKGGEIEYEFRTTFVPGLLTRNDIFEIVKWISPAKRYFLQDFRPTKTIKPEFKMKHPYEREYLVETLRLIQPFFETCELRGE